MIITVMSKFFYFIVLIKNHHKPIISRKIFNAVRNKLKTKKNTVFNTFVGTEELAHLEMIGAIVYQLTRNLTEKEIVESGFDTYFVDHTTGIYPIAASGVPFTASYLQSKGDILTDLHEDLAAEQKARTTYDNILRFCDDPDVADPIKFLRQREIVHYQRFGEALRLTTERLDAKNYYICNPAFDKPCGCNTKPFNCPEK